MAWAEGGIPGHSPAEAGCPGGFHVGGAFNVWTGPLQSFSTLKPAIVLPSLPEWLQGQTGLSYAAWSLKVHWGASYVCVAKGTCVGGWGQRTSLDATLGAGMFLRFKMGSG